MQELAKTKQEMADTKEKLAYREQEVARIVLELSEAKQDLTGAKELLAQTVREFKDMKKLQLASTNRPTADTRQEPGKNVQKSPHIQHESAKIKTGSLSPADSTKHVKCLQQDQKHVKDIQGLSQLQACAQHVSEYLDFPADPAIMSSLTIGLWRVQLTQKVTSQNGLSLRPYEMPPKMKFNPDR